MSIGIIYDNTIRNNGTAVYAWHALELLGTDVWHYLPSGQPSRENAPGILDHDYYIYIDDGRDDLGAFDTSRLPNPCAYWAVDTHLGYDHRFAMAKGMEHAFTAQKDGAARMTKDGHASAHWLPLACHPEAHVHIPMEKKKDIAFVGFLNADWRDCPKDRNNRIEWLEDLYSHFPKSTVATSVFFEEMSYYFCQAKLGFNISIKEDLNMRFFEVLSTGTALLSNRSQVGWKELGFIDGEDFIGYDGKEELIDKARFYLDNDPERLLISETGYRKARAGHTYAHRMKQMLEVIGYPCPGDPVKLSERYDTFEKPNQRIAS